MFRYLQKIRNDNDKIAMEINTPEQVPRNQLNNLTHCGVNNCFHAEIREWKILADVYSQLQSKLRKHFDEENVFEMI